MLLQIIDSMAQTDSILDGGRPFAMFLDDTGMETQMVEAASGGFWGYLTSIFQSEFFLGALTAMLMLYACENMMAILQKCRSRGNEKKHETPAEE